MSITAHASLISEHAMMCRECPPQALKVLTSPSSSILEDSEHSRLWALIRERKSRRRVDRGYTWRLGRGYAWRVVLSLLLVSVLSSMNWIALLQHHLLSTIWNFTHQELILYYHFPWTEIFPTRGRWDTHKAQEIKSQVTGKSWNLQDWHCWFPALHK